MRLDKYIEKHGNRECAELFGFTEGVIRSYRYGARFPRPERANVIVSITGGEVSLADIYAGRQKPARLKNQTT